MSETDSQGVTKRRKQDKRRFWSWVIVVVSLLALLFFVYWYQFIFNPLLLALLAAYILNPVVVFLCKWFSRGASVTIIFILLFGMLTASSLFIATLVSSEINSVQTILIGEDKLELEKAKKHEFWPMDKPEERLKLIKKRKIGLINTVRLWCYEKAFEYNKEYKFSEDGPLEEAFEWPGISKWVRSQFSDTGSINEESTEGGRIVGGVIKTFFNSIGGFLQILLYLLLVPIFTFFCMLQLDNLRDMIFANLPYDHRSKIIEILYKIHDSISAFFRGRILIAIILVTLCTPLLMLCEVSFSKALIMALIFGAVIVVPYAWIAINVIPTIVIICWSNPDPFWPSFWSVAIYIGLACLEMFVLIPAILGKSVDLHPVLLLLSIFLFGSIFGLFGVLLAVPLACIVKILFQGYVLTRLKILSQAPLET